MRKRRKIILTVLLVVIGAILSVNWYYRDAYSKAPVNFHPVRRR
jgi:hypothetical protein